MAEDTFTNFFLDCWLERLNLPSEDFRKGFTGGFLGVLTEGTDFRSLRLWKKVFFLGVLLGMQLSRESQEKKRKKNRRATAPLTRSRCSVV